MKPQIFIISLAAALLLSVSAFAQSTTAPQANAEAATLLQQMLDSEKHLAVSGDQATILYRPEQTFSATLSIERKGDHDLRIEFRSPTAVRGDVFVDNGRVSWHEIASARRLEVGPSNLGRLRQESHSVLMALQAHQLNPQILGQDVVAGKKVQIVDVTATGSWGERKYWIDPTNGAQLKIETFGALGQMVSQTYYTRVHYDANFGTNEFGPPNVDSNFTLVPMTPDGSTTISAIPTSDQCGFQIMQPSYLPNGFVFQSSVTMPMKGRKLVALNYANGLITLSIFEQPHTPHRGEPQEKNEFDSPRQNVLTAQENGYRYILVGALPENILEQIVLSMK